ERYAVVVAAQRAAVVGALDAADQRAVVHDPLASRVVQPVRRGTRLADADGTHRAPDAIRPQPAVDPVAPVLQPGARRRDQQPVHVQVPRRVLLDPDDAAAEIAEPLADVALDPERL